MSSITIFAACLSTLITITTSALAVYIIHYFFFPLPEAEEARSPTCVSPTTGTIDGNIAIEPIPPIGPCPSHSIISFSPKQPSINTGRSVELALPPLSPSIAMPNSQNSTELHTTLGRSNSVSKSTTKIRSSISRRGSDRSEKTDSHHSQRDIASFVRYLSAFIALFNALNAGFNTVYCVWLVVEPGHAYEFYTQHPAHTQRVTSTVSWYIAKTLFLWLLSYRLYRAFKGSLFSVNTSFLLFLNITNSVIAPVGLCIAYWAVYTQQPAWIAEFAFNFWRVFYQVIVVIILYMFCSRLLQLVIDNKMIIMREKEISKRNANRMRIQTPIKISHEFLEVVTRHSLLVVTVSITVAATGFCFFGFRFIFLPQTSVTLLIPMNMAALDSMVTSVCMVCLFPMGGPLYRKLCGWPDLCLSKMCLFCARKTVA